LNEIHHIESRIKGRRLLYASSLNIAISIAEVIGGILANSLSLVSDALHNISDAIATLVAYIANRIGQRPSNERKTFGYKRIEILAAFLNALVLAGVSVFLFYEAIKRLLSPEPVEGKLMFIIATIGLFANLLAVLLLRSDAEKNINVKAAYIHLLSDTLSSIAVLIGGIIIYFYRIYWIDPVITILIGLYILKETWIILRKATDILMQSAPEGVKLNAIKADLENIPAIENIHHVHIWNMDDQFVHFECHIDLQENTLISETEKT